VTQDRLGPYFVTTQRYSPQLGGRSGVRGLVDGIVNELQLPCTLDEDGDWRLTSDVGPVLLIWREDQQKLRALQVLEKVGGRPKSNADLLLGLLRLNLDAETACFAIAQDAGQDYAAITGLIPAEEITREEVERVIEDVLRLSRMVDELTGNVPAPVQPPAAAAPAAPVTDIPAGWYTDPQGQARLRYWDGAAWTAHTAD
jgi:hypothetical protein